MSDSVDVDVETLKLIAGGGRPAEGAITALFRKYRRPLLGFLLHRGVDPATAEDLVQEAFIKVAKAAAAFRGESKVSSWLHTITRNAHLDHVRRARPEVNLDDEGWAIVEADVATAGDDDPAQQLQKRQLDECLDRQYKIFANEHPAAACALEKVSEFGWALREVAQFLGRTEAATKEYMYQCRKKLKAAWAPCHELWKEES